jgi:hypothetical protein
MRLGWLLGVLAAAAGCAAARPVVREDQSARGWATLVDGKDDEAWAAFTRALQADPTDAYALFGMANLAYERGDDPTALGASLDLLELAGRGEAAALRLSAATLVRLPRLLAEIPDRRPAEKRVLALSPERLPWVSRYALAMVAMDIARSRGDGDLLAQTAQRSGCVTEMAQVGDGGRLPLVDFPPVARSSSTPRTAGPASRCCGPRSMCPPDATTWCSTSVAPRTCASTVVPGTRTADRSRSTVHAGPRAAST